MASVVRVRHPERSDDDLQRTLCGDTTMGSVATNPHPIAPAWVVQSYPTFKTVRNGGWPDQSPKTNAVIPKKPSKASAGHNMRRDSIPDAA